MEDEKLKNIIKNIVDEDENIDVNSKQYLNEIIFKIIKEIIDLPNEKETTIAELINYNPENEFIEPLIQGQINYFVKTICNSININYTKTDDSIGGLAFYVKFKKMNDMNDEEIVDKIIEKIKNMPYKKKFTIAELTDIKENKQLFKVTMEVLKKAKEQNINLKNIYGENAIVGLPQNIELIKVKGEKYE